MSNHLYLIGEALIGKEPKIAHIGLIIGDKEGPAQAAVAKVISDVVEERIIPNDKIDD